MPKTKYIIGIDEAGRGPLAGPLAVGAVIIQSGFYPELKKLLRNIKGKDSKKLTEKEREFWFKKMHVWQQEQKISFCVCLISAEIIDSKRLNFAVKKGITSCIKKLLKNLEKDSPEKFLVLLDGSLKAPEEFLNQKTIIKGDEKEPIISLASIAAKVTRDRKMLAFSKISEFSCYKFEEHKGYGTKKHRELIDKHGVSVLHRKSFIKA